MNHYVIDDKLWTLPAAQYEQFQKDVAHYNVLLNEQRTAEEKLAKETEDQASAEEYLANVKQETIDLYGEETEAINEATDAVADYKGKSEEAWKESTKGAKAAADAIKAVADYYKGVRDATEQAVNSAVKGFEKIGAAGDDNRKKSNELATKETETLTKYAAVWKKWGSDNEALKKMKAYVDGGKKLTKTEQEAYEALVKIRNEQKEVNDGRFPFRRRY